MKWVWNWGGECFGYFDGDDLWTYSGKHVGKRFEDEIYGPDGAYMGEVMNSNRLIFNHAKATRRRYGFAAYGRRSGYARYASYSGYSMYSGYQDFESADSF